MEDGLGEYFKSCKATCMLCLNPCFSGGWSRRLGMTSTEQHGMYMVLILVLVEDGLGVYKKYAK